MRKANRDATEGPIARGTHLRFVHPPPKTVFQALPTRGAPVRFWDGTSLCDVLRVPVPPQD